MNHHLLLQLDAGCLATRAALPLPRRRILKLLEALNTFYRGSGVEALVLDSATVAAVHNGVFPWSAAAPVNGERSAQRYFAQLWRTATSKLARTVEEDATLRLEVVRLFGWLETRLADVAANDASLEAAAELCDAEEGAGAASGSGAAAAAAAAATAAHKSDLARAAHRALIAGKRAILELEKARVESIEVKAREHLERYLPRAPAPPART
jgi:hypothetical protein